MSTPPDHATPNVEAAAEAAAIWAVIPAYAEARHIGATVAGVAPWVSHIVVVDDGSPDDTAAVAAAAGASVIRQPRNLGKGAALRIGLSHALREGAGLVLTLDADGQHDPADIAGFLAARRETGAPVVVGNRMADPRGMPVIRRLTNRFMSALLSRRMGRRVPDTQNGFRLYAREVLPWVVRAGCDGFAQESEVLLDLAAAGFAIASAPTRIIYADERSAIHPVRDTVRFFAMLRRNRRRPR